jgi:uncharacterized protein
VAFTAWDAIGLAGLGLAVGAFGTLVGAGGGFILTPILLLLYPHDSPQEITGISLAVVFCNAASGTAAYARLRRIDYRSGLVFGASTLPGSVLGALAVAHVSRHIFDLTMIAVLAFGAIWLVLGHDPDVQPKRNGTSRTLRDASGKTLTYNVQVARGAFYSLGVGFVSTFLGIGGGVLHVPLLVRALGFPTHIATATSHFVLTIMAGSATITHLAAGSLRPGHGLRRALALSVGVVLGAQFGARLSARVSSKMIERLLATALALLALRLLIGVL